MSVILSDDKQGEENSILVFNIIQCGEVQRKLDRCSTDAVGSFSNSYFYNLKEHDNLAF